ncbi:histidine phosphatase family protein [Laceyella putida]|uniref:Histidine phosphatase family protein n=1 Tax=Laceyella putida TaxID=110101 RepID=A0ABW2RQ09_9BACL
MQILLIRHGQSEADLREVHEGRADFPLTEKGIEQAHKMARRVKEDFPPDYVWASTLKRASETASILAKTIGCPINYLPELHEHDNGKLAGRPLAETSFPLDILPHVKLGETGESGIEFRARAEHAFSYIKHYSKSYRRIAIVSHGGMISRMLESFLGMPVHHDCFIQTSDTGIHLIEYHERGRLVHFLNSDSHAR